MVREAEAEIGKGVSPGDMAKKCNVSEWILHRWRQRYGALSTPEAKRIRDLEEENLRLKKGGWPSRRKENEALRELNKGKF